jgi:hypothetical protein
LIKLNEYEEARKVRNMIDKILPGEERKHEREYRRLNELKRQTLRDAHIDDIARLDEKLKAMTWSDKRRREGEYARHVHVYLMIST